MSFTPIPENKSTFSTRKTEYLALVPGNTVIRILDPDYFSVETHFINRTSVECLGDECPICKNNRKIILENPETFRDISGYSPRSRRYFVNVYDKTPAKVCPQCGAEIKQDIPTCPSCNTIITAVERKPLDKVKVLAKGKQLFEQLIALEQVIVDETGTPRGLTNFDITLVTAGAGKTATCTPIFTGNVGAPVFVEKPDLFDLHNAVIKLSEDELHDFQSGVSLKDIFAARRLGKETSTPSATNQSAIQSAMELFK